MENELKALREKLNNSTIALLEIIQGDGNEDTTNQTGDDNERVPNSRRNIRGIPLVKTDREF